jgi:hypothetical protein
MTVIVHHGKKQDEAIVMVDGSLEKLLAGVGGGSLEITGLKKDWDGPKMKFSLVAKLGFISIPISGSAHVEITTLTVELVLPPMVKNFIGEADVRRGVETRLGEIFAA